MVSRQLQEGSTISRVLVPKVNQDSFKVIKGFPSNTKPFNWMFELYDGHGPNGEQVSQYATKRMPDLLDDKLQKISNELTLKIY